MGSIPLPFLVVIIFPFWHYMISVAFVWPKFKAWQRTQLDEHKSWKEFKSRVLWHNEPPHKLSSFWGTLKQLISFLVGTFCLIAAASYG